MPDDSHRDEYKHARAGGVVSQNLFLHAALQSISYCDIYVMEAIAKRHKEPVNDGSACNGSWID